MAAQKRHCLSDRHVQMARELGLNPDKLGKIDNHRQEPWKATLPQFIENIYFKRSSVSSLKLSGRWNRFWRKWNSKRSSEKRKRMNGGNSVFSLPIQQQSKQRSHDMKRSLKATRFSDFAFFILTSCSVLIFSWRLSVFIFSLISAGCQKIFFISFGNPFPM